jgi:hypothetical protein
MLAAIDAVHPADDVATHTLPLLGWPRMRLQHRSRCARPLHTLLVIWLGLAVSLSAALAQDEPIPSAQSSQVNVNKPAHFQIWRRITLDTYKGVDAYRDALDSAKIKIGDSADEILGRPAFPYARTKTDVELAVLSAADLGVESDLNAPGKLVLSCALLGSDRSCGWSIAISRLARLLISRWSRWPRTVATPRS